VLRAVARNDRSLEVYPCWTSNAEPGTPKCPHLDAIRPILPSMDAPVPFPFVLGGEASAKHTSAKDTMELEEVASTFDRIDVEDPLPSPSRDGTRSC
jgi:hypothetical protein